MSLLCLPSELLLEIVRQNFSSLDPASIRLVCSTMNTLLVENAKLLSKDLIKHHGLDQDIFRIAFGSAQALPSDSQSPAVQSTLPIHQLLYLSRALQICLPMCTYLAPRYTSSKFWHPANQPSPVPGTLPSLLLFYSFNFVLRSDPPFGPTSAHALASFPSPFRPTKQHISPPSNCHMGPNPFTEFLKNSFTLSTLTSLIGTVGLCADALFEITSTSTDASLSQYQIRMSSCACCATSSTEPSVQSHVHHQGDRALWKAFLTEMALWRGVSWVAEVLADARAQSYSSDGSSSGDQGQTGERQHQQQSPPNNYQPHDPKPDKAVNDIVLSLLPPGTGGRKSKDELGTAWPSHMSTREEIVHSLNSFGMVNFLWRERERKLARAVRQRAFP